MPAGTVPPGRRRRASTAVAYGGRVGAREDWWDDPGDDLDLGRRRTVPARPRPSPGLADFVASVLLLGAAVLASPAAWFAVVIGQLAFTACADSSAQCDVGGGEAVRNWHLVGTLVVLVGGIGGTVARRSRGRTGWPVALATLLGVVVVFVVAIVTIQVLTGGRED